MNRRSVISVAMAGAVLSLVLRVSPPVSAQAQPAPVADPTAPFFNNTVLHDVYFTVNTKDWLTLKENYLSNEYYPVDFKWGTTTVRNAGIRSRGTGSRSGEKPGLRLDFDRYTSNQKFLGLKSLVFRNSTQDPSNMHEQLSMLLFKRLGLVAPREVYARLFVNNAYAGLYSIVESIDKTFVAANFGNDAGYIYKYDYNVTDAGYYFAYRSSNPGDYVPLPFKPETHETDPQPEVFERFVWTINNATDSSFRTAIAEFMDMAELVRHVATEVFVADNDGFLGNWGMNNFYLYRFADRSPVPVHRLGQERSVQGHARLLDLAQPSRYAPIRRATGCGRARWRIRISRRCIWIRCWSARMRSSRCRRRRRPTIPAAGSSAKSSGSTRSSRQRCWRIRRSRIRTISIRRRSTSCATSSANGRTLSGPRSPLLGDTYQDSVGA